MQVLSMNDPNIIGNAKSLLADQSITELGLKHYNLFDSKLFK